MVTVEERKQIEHSLMLRMASRAGKARMAGMSKKQKSAFARAGQAASLAVRRANKEKRAKGGANATI